MDERESTKQDREPIKPVIERPPEVDSDWMAKVDLARRMWEQTRKANEGKPVSLPPLPRLKVVKG